MSSTYVRLRAGGEDYALPVGEVIEVIRLAGVDPVLGAPPATLGVCSLRGQPLPVFDLAQLLGLQAGASLERIVVTRTEQGRVGWAVEAVLDVEDLPADQAPASGDWLRSSVLVDGVLVGVVDLPAVVARLEDGIAG